MLTAGAGYHAVSAGLVSLTVCFDSVTALSRGECRASLRVVKLNYCKQITADCLLTLARTCQRSATLTSHTLTQCLFSLNEGGHVTCQSRVVGCE